MLGVDVKVEVERVEVGGEQLRGLSSGIEQASMRVEQFDRPDARWDTFGDVRGGRADGDACPVTPQALIRPRVTNPTESWLGSSRRAKRGPFSTFGVIRSSR